MLIDGLSVMTPLSQSLIWQAYYYGADINFRDQNPTAAIGGYAPYDVYDTDELSRILKQGSW
ncbi:hypothetical protein [Brevibacillus sp. SKDU10]|uniref:hypothetical protein n=1 Tax=Brevibacillus sp. SKDU10 TaxID=1247872 RepID=UPI0012FB37D5|nr:hypothetical protein [Brevibacillus sp. SKDU10]